MSKNLATTTIVSHPGPPTSAMSVTVATGTGSRLFTGMAVIHPADAVPTAANAEVVSITDVTGDVVTIVRAQESSTARAIVTGDILTQGITAAMWDALVASNAGKAATSHAHSAADVTSGTLPLARGGTGGTDAATARTSLGLGSAATMTPATISADAALTATYGRLIAGQTYVPSTGVAATDTSALQAAHDAFPATGGTILLDRGPYLVTGVVFTKPVRVIGSGPNGVNVAAGASHLKTGTLINCATTNAAALTFACDGWTMEGVSLVYTGGSTPVTGSTGITVAPTSPAGRNWRLLNCDISGFYRCVDIVNGYEYIVDNCTIFDPVHSGIRVRDVDLPDGGDGKFNNCFFYSGPTNLTPAAAIDWASGGGVTFVGSKINQRGTAKFDIGLNFQPSSGTSTSVLMVTGSSIENTNYGMLFQGAAGDGTYNKLAIVGNEFFCTLMGIGLVPIQSGHYQNISIDNNVGNGGAGAANTGLICLRNVSGVAVGPGNIAIGGTLVTDMGNNGGVRLSGQPFTTVGRFAASQCAEGSWYYDTTLDKPAWRDAAGNWKDAAGTTV